MTRDLIVAVVPALLMVNSQFAAAQWTQLAGGPEGHLVSSLASNHQTLFVGTAGPGNPFFFVSTNQGGNWHIPDSTIMAVNSVVIGRSGIFAGTGGSGIYRSTDQGLNWVDADSGLTYASVDVIVTNGVSLFAGTSGGGVFRSTDQGTSWSEADTGLTHPTITSMTLSGTYAFAGTYAGGVFVSSDNGAAWMPANDGLTQSTINDLVTCGTDVFAGTGSGVFRTTTNGSHWVQMNSGLTDTIVTVLGAVGAQVFAGTQSGVFLSTDGGGSWTDVSSGLPQNSPVLSLAFDSTYVYTGLYYGGVWRRLLSEMITSVAASVSELPHNISLSQNYPNPFNPTTAVSYQLSAVSEVKLVVYDMLGREVTVLVNEKKGPGRYEVQFDASRLASGVYCYRLISGSYVETRKMILMR